MAQLEIVRSDVPLTGETESYIRERAEHLETLHPRVSSCRVTVDAPAAHHRQGGPYRVALDITVPGRVVAVNHRQADDLHVAIRKAFDAAQRQLDAQAKIHHHHHADQRALAHAAGKVVRLFRADGYGFIEAEDGREVYFQQNTVTGAAFGQLEVGTSVRFVEADGENPQVVTVEVR